MALEGEKSESGRCRAGVGEKQTGEDSKKTAGGNHTIGGNEKQHMTQNFKMKQENTDAKPES